MKKSFIIVALVVIIAIFVAGCNGLPLSQTNADIAYSKVYREAITLGFEGTLQEFIDLVRGCDGNGVEEVIIDDDGYLCVRYTHNKELVKIGRVKGENGKDGRCGIDGISIVNVTINQDSELLIELSNGDVQNLGVIFDNISTDIVDNDNYLSIQEFGIDGDGYLYVLFKNQEEPILIGKVQGCDGINGQDGKDGIDGKDGKDGENGQNGIDGQDGKDGQNGQDGIDGQDGKDGENGQNGIDGQNGKSAYEIYKEYHPDYDKTEYEWLMDFIKGNLIAKYKVTFHFYDGTQDIVEVWDSEKVAMPTLQHMDRENYIFIGWNIGSEDGVSFDFDTVITQDIHLYAVYEHEQPKLEYMGQIDNEQEVGTNSYYQYDLYADMFCVDFSAASGHLICQLMYKNEVVYSQEKSFDGKNGKLTIVTADLGDYEYLLYDMQMVILYTNGDVLTIKSI